MTDTQKMRIIMLEHKLKIYDIASILCLSYNYTRKLMSLCKIRPDQVAKVNEHMLLSYVSQAKNE